ncbi:MAG: DUF5107 domain-containing protein [Limisphaera sp.]|nr:DUF5107 domain-containing protein [Limisphaera sp.]
MKARAAFPSTACEPASIQTPSPAVRVDSFRLELPTWLPARPDPNPMFLERRVYQGSSGRVYPLPFTDRIAEAPVPRAWEVVRLENRWLEVWVLPELGGRVHRLRDKTSGADLIYFQPVIKPALVGLAGPWISGGIEFNWPQHHRPATFLPVETAVERHPDGSVTVWCSDHDPLQRMKGMHGVCLHPDQAVLHLKVRAHNRTPFVQTFLWWANAAVRVHEAYQSFFPPDVTWVADHAKRAVVSYPLARGAYYGVDYARRARHGVPADEVPRQFVPPHCRSCLRAPAVETPPWMPDYPPNDLRWYANIPTPCSYMCLRSEGEFFGGYDHRTGLGLVHVADPHIAPGKKQWTWGNHEFGYAWDRNLTEPDESGIYPPYIELMAGVYTDNQPDFSFLRPGETKTWSQYWYPIRDIGPVQKANLQAAVSLHLHPTREAANPPDLAAGARGPTRVGALLAQLGVCVTRPHPKLQIVLERKAKPWARFQCDLAPDRAFLRQVALPPDTRLTDLTLRVLDAHGAELLVYTPAPPPHTPPPQPATEPPPPEKIRSPDELYLTGRHLDQYRHATRCPTLYWREALRRDPLDARCNEAMGRWHLGRGEFDAAAAHLRRAIQRLTTRNPNPEDTGAFYHLGLCLRFAADLRLARSGRAARPAAGADPDPQALRHEARAMFAKAAWDGAWAAAALRALAEMDCCNHAWDRALEQLNQCLRLNADCLGARNLKVMVLRRLGRHREAVEILRDTLALDPLDVWARWLHRRELTRDAQAALDIVHDLARAGFDQEAIELLHAVAANLPALLEAQTQPDRLPDQNWGVAPLVYYTLAWLHGRQGQSASARQALRQAAKQPPEYCFPARLEEIAVLEFARAHAPRDPRAPYYLGNLLFDRRRYAEAIALWEHSARLDPRFPIVWRNLGIAYYNVQNRPGRARSAYERAFSLNPGDARLLYERDQLWKRLRVSPRRRLRELQRHPALVQQRDDLTVELCALLNQTGRPEAALSLLQRRRFQPWEGGEGQVLGQWMRTHLVLGRRALRQGRSAEAAAHFQAALEPPPNLGEARHLLANVADVHYWLGCARAALGDSRAARRHWRRAAALERDFQEMSVQPFSEKTVYAALAWQRLGHPDRARRLLQALLDYARRRQRQPARIDYFATSLPTMLLFVDDLRTRQRNHGRLMEAQALWGLGHPARARTLLRRILREDPAQAEALDLWEELQDRTCPMPAGSAPCS